MREIRVSSTLTVYHDGQFWVGLFECVEGGRLSVSRIVFGSEPSGEEICHLVCQRWNHLCFTRPVVDDEAPKVHANPKRRQREASRALAKRGPSTKAQQALAQEREAQATEHRAERRSERERERTERFEQRRQRQKRRHRGK